MDFFDYIIVGGGTAGCVLANRLSENKSNSVLLIEAGSRKYNPWLYIPGGYFKTIFSKKLNWRYETQPEKELNFRKIVWPRGKVLGGSGAINGMVYIRGQKEDFDHWKDLGNSEWSYEKVLPFFIKSEKQKSKNDELNKKYHNTNGLFYISDYPNKFILSETFIEAANEQNIKTNYDFNGAFQSGAGYYQITTNNWLRSDSDICFLKPALKRSNLTVLTNTLVTKIIIKNKKVIGVKVSKNGNTKTLKCGKEVILSAGTVNSPQLLQISGIGDQKYLSKIGIKTILDLPEVGENLQDHLQSQIIYKCDKNISLNSDLVSFTGKIKILIKYLFFHRGFLAGGPTPAGAFVSTRKGVTRPNLQLHFLPLSMSKPGIINNFDGYTINISLSRPKSKGRVRIISSDPTKHPLIEANYLSEKHDKTELIEGIKISRKIANSKAFQKYNIIEIKPGSNCNSQIDLLNYIKDNAGSLYHPIGTCRMGVDKNSVVNQDLQVRGILGLRVADASIMPSIISGNTNATVVMIAEKASEIIKKST